MTGRSTNCPRSPKRINAGLQMLGDRRMILTVAHSGHDGRAVPADAAPLAARTQKIGDAVLVPAGGTWNTGRRYWPRHVVQARINAGDQRHHPERTGAGRRPGDPRNQAPAAAAAAPRPACARRPPTARASAEGQAPVTAADLAQRYDVSHRTAERLLTAAREYLATIDPSDV
ncbi:hypothetical protein [Streptomyces sp. NPDC057280]|uniref:hypothetical protein n=1 Tax=Streptomyces sp. NPDC057280 TaxID=3346081 RepID=UPI003637C1AD